MTLTELRDALHKATGPDRLLDQRVAEWCGPDAWLPGGGPRTDWPRNYTASIDAAVTLVPEEVGCRMYLRSAGAVFRSPIGAEIEVGAPTLPLALCLARIEYELAKAQAAEEAGHPAGAERA